MNKKLAFGMLFLLIFLGSMPVLAQTPPEFTNVVIIVQENRTPDNLFQDQTLINNGADILEGEGLSSPQKLAKCSTAESATYLWPLPPGTGAGQGGLDPCWDPNHLHDTFEMSYDSGAWDGACNITIITPDSCTPYKPGGSAVAANYTYVPNYPNSGDSCPCILDPYYQIAETVGFANYMFQTNQGPSYPAHQFLFSGTSAPVGYHADSGDYFEMYASEIPFTGDEMGEHALDNLKNFAGCASYWDSYEDIGDDVYKHLWTQEYDLESFNSGTEDFFYGPPAYSYLGFPCYSHPSLANLIEGGGYNWKYYIQDSSEDNEIWSAPNSLNAICEVDPGGSCSADTGNGDWANVDDTMGDILKDIYNCNLKNVSWVIPDGTWSDHPGTNPVAVGDAGPSWVAAIVNAIGGVNDYACKNDSNYYWSGTKKTLVLITWDDWGGWYDHIEPPNASSINSGYGNKTGSNDSNDGDYYVYGFRVPLLVVSAYNKHCSGDACSGGYTGYISGPTVDGETANYNAPYIHDFGSILGFIEWNFNLSPYPDPPDDGCGIAYGDPTNFPDGCQYEFADWFAPDGYYECLESSACGDGYLGYPLQDFFNFGLTSFPSFTEITGAKYAPGCFVAPTGETCWGSSFVATDPDDDVSEAEQ